MRSMLEFVRLPQRNKSNVFSESGSSMATFQRLSSAAPWLFFEMTVSYLYMHAQMVVSSPVWAENKKCFSIIRGGKKQREDEARTPSWFIMLADLRALPSCVTI